MLIPFLNLSWFTLEEPVLYGSNKVMRWVLPISNSEKGFNLNGFDFVLIVSSLLSLILLHVFIQNIIRIKRIKNCSEITQMGGL
jgi:hypothetical protein